MPRLGTSDLTLGKHFTCRPLVPKNITKRIFAPAWQEQAGYTGNIK